MGNQQSIATTINNTINKSITNVLMSSSTSCNQNNSVQALISFNNITTKGGCQLKFDNISQTINAAPNLVCAQSSANQADLATKFQTELNQNTTAITSGLGGAINSTATTNAINKLKNEIINNINISSIANCVQNNIASATQNYSNITMDCTGCGLVCTGKPQVCVNTCQQEWTNITQNLTLKAVANCTQTNTGISRAVAEASNSIEQTLNASNIGTDIFAPFQALSTFSIAIIIIIALLCLFCSSGALAFFFYSSSGRTK
jgi:hypothetical protein